MEFEMETELLPAPAGRPHNRRKHIVTIAFTAVTCILLIIFYVKLGSVNIEEKTAGCQTGLRVVDGHKGQGGAPGAERHPGEPGLHGSPTEPKGNTESGPAGLLVEVETLTAGFQNLPSSKGIVEGIIAGTSDGVVIISLDSLEQRTISSSFTLGVAFNWQTRKVYWIESYVGIKIADLDGSHATLLIADKSYLSGLALDHITGNLYYGVEGRNPRIQVCDSMGKKCATIFSEVNHVGNDIWDIALSPSEGLIFWSSPWDDKSVTRANMDGTNATTIISERIFGLYSDEFNEKLYWANGKSIGNTDLNGSNLNVLLDPSVHPFDIAVDGDTVYFTGDVLYDGHSVKRHSSHIYSVTSNREVFSIANTTGPVDHINLFGRSKVSSRPNSCSNSPCANLCVLTPLSYTCL